jgi:hypothetical protein
VNWQNMLDALEFKSHRIFNQNIHSVTAVQVDTLELNRQGHLSAKRYSTETQLVTETFLVCRLKKARTECSMHFDGSANHLFCQIFVKQFTPWLCVSVVKHDSLPHESCLQHSHLELGYVRVQRGGFERLCNRIARLHRVDDLVDP